MKIHLIGIGGIGVSALAQYYLSKGHQVSGSDLVASEITDFLKKQGVKIFIGNFAKNINKDLDLVVYSPAVKFDNAELKKAKSCEIKAISYPEALGELTKEYYTIAISGSHGKSTTTAMIALVLEKAGLDPTVIVGTKLKEFNNSNFRSGKSRLLVIEACEYDSSFKHYSPSIAVVNNIDKEHLDYFKDLKGVIKAFKNFILKLPSDGFLVFNSKEQNMPVFKEPKFKLSGYSIDHPEAKKIKKALKIPGQHNVLNALSAFEVSKILAVPENIFYEVISNFEGTWRRFEVKSGKAESKAITVISDYGHHPNEISATLQAAREKYKNKTIWCVFQPHQHQRTYYLFNDFVKVFKEALADKIILTDIYDVAGRETKKINSGVNSRKIVKKVNKESVIYCACLPVGRRQFDDLEKYIKKNIKSGDILIIMGAGDIYKLADKF